MDIVLDTAIKKFEDTISSIEEAKNSIERLGDAVYSINNKMETASKSNLINEENIKILEEKFEKQENRFKDLFDKFEDWRNYQTERINKANESIELFFENAKSISEKLKIISKEYESINEEINKNNLKLADENIKNMVDKIKNAMQESNEIITYSLNIQTTIFEGFSEFFEKESVKFKENMSQIFNENCIANMEKIIESIENENEVIIEQNKQIIEKISNKEYIAEFTGIIENIVRKVIQDKFDSNETIYEKAIKSLNKDDLPEACHIFYEGIKNKDKECLEKIIEMNNMLNKYKDMNNSEYLVIKAIAEEKQGSEDKAVKYFEMAGRKGDNIAQKRYLEICKELSKNNTEYKEIMGDIYYKGIFVEKDKEIAKEWYEAAIKEGRNTAEVKMKMYFS